MGIFSFGKKDDAAPRRRGAEAGSGWRNSSEGSRVERRSRRSDRSGDAEAMLLDPTLPEKQRARRRLVGAIALVVAAIVILPMVLDSHPKPVTDDIAIDIPSRPTTADRGAAARDEAADTQDGVAPDNPGASALANAAPGASEAAPAVSAQTAQNTASAPAAATAASAAPGSKTAPTAQAQTQAQTSHTSKPAAQTSANAAANATNTAATSHGTQSGAQNPSTKSNAESTDKTAAAEASAPGARYAVQLGAFSNDATARNWVTKLKAVGVPAYTEQRKQADGTTRTLLRAGPFADRQAASEAIAKVRGAGLMSGSNGSAD